MALPTLTRARPCSARWQPTEAKRVFHRRRAAARLIAIQFQGGAAGMILFNQSTDVTDLETDNHYLPAVPMLCIASGLPEPKIYVIDDPAPNAFATGRNPKHASVAARTRKARLSSTVLKTAQNPGGFNAALYACPISIPALRS